MTLQLRSAQRDALSRSSVGNRLATILREPAKEASYDPVHGRICVVGHRDQRTNIDIDEKGNLLQLVSPLGHATRYHYERGKLAAVQQPTGLLLRTNYDSAGRVARTERNDGTIHELAYDAAGNVCALRTADGATLRLEFGPEQRPERIIERDGSVVRREYDDDGRLVRIVDPLGHPTKLSYLQWDEPEQIEHPDGTIEQYAYAPGGAKQRVNAADHAEYTANDAGKITAAHYADGQSFELAYDDKGRVTKATSSDASVAYEYDDKGRVIAEDQDGQVIRYAYDADGYLARIELPDGKVSLFSYDLDGRLSAVRDYLGLEQRFHYGAAQQPVHRELPNGLIESYALDVAGRITAIDLHDRTHTYWYQRYERDAVGRLSTRSDSHHGAQRLQYDPRGQLLGVYDGATGSPLETYRYDLGANRSVSPHGVAAFDRMSRPVQRGAHTYGYDGLGNRIEHVGPAFTQHYKWSRQNLLTEASLPDGRKAKYFYDAFGRRVRKELGDAKVTYLWSGNHVLQELHDGPSGTRTVEYVYFPGTHQPLAKIENGQSYYYHCDQLGTPRLLTNAAAQWVWSARSDAFGVVQPEVHAVEQPLRFQGQYFDAETGLHYNRARYYDPELGSYLSRDPLAPLGDNGYAYAGNNPTNVIDPLGLIWEDAPGWVKVTATIVGAIGVGVAVGAAVVALAPAALAAGTVAAIGLVVGGLAGGAAGGAISEGMTENGCVACGAMKGAALGVIGAIPFLFAPAAAGLAVIAGFGAASAAIAYGADVLLFGHEWDTGEFALTVASGAVLGVAAKWITAKALNWRARRVTSRADKVLEPTSPGRAQKGHGHSEHGATTTKAQQEQRIRNGTKPSGQPGTAPGRASKFNTPEQEAEALRLGRRQLNQDVAEGKVAKYDPKPGEPNRPNRHEVKVATDNPEGFGSQWRRKKNPDGTNARDSNGDYVPEQVPAPLDEALIVYEYVPSSNSFEPVTYFPK